MSFTEVNGHTVVPISNHKDETAYACIYCKIRGPYVEAFEDIQECTEDVATGLY